ncbi:MAG: elongation factor 1-alpha C-terminal domain-related protein [Acidimicrobiales bacterium]
MSVVVRLADDIDVSRGDMICRPANQPSTSQDIEALVCWMAPQRLRQGGRYAIKHTTRWARAVVGDLRYRLDINTLHRDESATALDPQRDRPGAPAGDRTAHARPPTGATAPPAASSSSTRPPT